jgi:hypothetical protein
MDAYCHGTTSTPRRTGFRTGKASATRRGAPRPRCGGCWPETTVTLVIVHELVLRYITAAATSGAPPGPS